MKLINSQKYLEDALSVIPLGSQTFSRSHIFLDKNYFPLFNSSGRKQYLYDVDGNKFLDFINGLGSVSIGYGIKEINKDIISTLKKGVTFSLSHRLEYQVSKLLINLIPCAEMVRFGKNGTDVNSAAIRLARYFTKREKIAVCGYHGWQDWYIASTSMDGGITKETKKNTHTFEYNKIDSLKKLFKKNKYAAVILEPLSYEKPNNEFLKKVSLLCKKKKTLLIFDEICTGFRVSEGGVQKIYNVKPDLTTLGKGMANGYPISALVGKKYIMKNLDKIFYSGTFAGETISLQACKSTIEFILKNKTIKKNIIFGKLLKQSVEDLLEKYKLNNIINISGHESWLFMRYKSNSSNYNLLLKSFIQQELIKKKILFLGSFNINFSHNINNIKYLIKILKNIFIKIAKNRNNLNKLVYIKKSKPLFSVRKI